MLERYINREIENNIYELARDFAIRIVNMYKYLVENNKEYIMSKQLFRSGTSIGANVFEGKNAQSRPDFASKMSIALKEATESAYWIDLLHETNIVYASGYVPITKMIKTGFIIDLIGISLVTIPVVILLVKFVMNV